MKRSVEKPQEKSKSSKRFISILIVALLVVTSYGAFIYSIFVSSAHLELVTSLALAFSALSFAGTISLWILVSARMLSTHEFRFLDLKEATRKPKANPNGDPLDPENLEEFAKSSVEKLFPKEKTLTDQLS